MNAANGEIKLKYKSETIDEIWDTLESNIQYITNADIPPVVCLAINKKNEKIKFHDINNEEPYIPKDMKKNIRENIISVWMHHAENYVIKKIVDNGYDVNEFDFFISFQPCNGCVRRFKKNNISKVYVLFDKGYVSEEESKGGFESRILLPDSNTHQEKFNKIKFSLEKHIDLDKIKKEQEKIDSKKKII